MIRIYTENISARFNWTADFIFEEILQIEFEITDHQPSFTQYSGPAINYSANSELPGLLIRPHGLIGELGIRNIEVEVERGEYPIFFPNESDIGYDIFSAIFYLVSRYEEYLPHKKDKHGRFPAKESIAFRNRFLQLPIVDIWAGHLKSLLQKKYPDLNFPGRDFHFISTYDIDVAYAHKGRSIARETRSKVKDWLQRDSERLRERKGVLAGINPDPYDTYDYQNSWREKLNLDTRYFFLVAHYGQYDRNISIESDVMKNLIQSIALVNPVGLHPSYRTSQKIGLAMNEKMSLENVLGKKVTQSRQHFLRFTLPQTYRTLEDIGIQEDYSMGFADHIGFRAGTSNPFYFFDLENNERTNLKIFPVTIMDSSLKSYMDLTPEQATKQISRLITEVKKVHGTFISIWHNHTLNDHGEWKGWRWVYESMLDQIQSNS